MAIIKDRLLDRLKGWDKKKLSWGGKEILIKFVAKTLLNYPMNVFLISMEIYKELEQAMCKFWWRTNSSKEKFYT